MNYCTPRHVQQARTACQHHHVQTELLSSHPLPCISVASETTCDGILGTIMSVAGLQAFHENMEDELRQAAEHPVLPSCLQRSRDMERLQKDKARPPYFSPGVSSGVAYPADIRVINAADCSDFLSLLTYGLCAQEKLQGAITELQRTIEALEKERPHPEAAGEGKRKAQQVEGAAKKVPKIEVPKGISVSSGAGTGQLVLQSECGDFDIHFK